MSEHGMVEVGSRYDLRDQPLARRARHRGLRRARGDASAGSTPTRPAPRWTGRACGSCSSCPAACCAASICHNPDTWHLKDGTRIELAHAVRRLGDFAPALRAMGGGLTISGGEPLVQLGFTRGCSPRPSEMGLHTALDTSGFLGHRADDDYLANVDLVLLDIKSGDPDTYRQVTGVRISQPTLRFAERLDAMGKPVWVRFVLVPGLTDDPEQHREGGALRRADEERGMGRGAALPPDGRLQVEVARARLSARRIRRHRPTQQVQRGARDLPRCRLPRALTEAGWTRHARRHQRPDRHAADPRALPRHRPRLRGRADQHPRLLARHRRRAVRRPVHRRHRAQGADRRARSAWSA